MKRDYPLSNLIVDPAQRTNNEENALQIKVDQFKMRDPLSTIRVFQRIGKTS